MDELDEYLKCNSLTFDMSSVPELLKCLICHGVMIKAKQTKCGCVYCDVCIRRYLENECKQCPGCLKDKVNNNIKYDRDLDDDCRSNKAILKLKFKCPINDCDKIYELGNMLAHIVGCQMKKKSCLLQNIGCSITNLNETELDNHIHSSMRSHFELISDLLCKLKCGFESLQSEHAEVSIIKNDMTQLTTEIEELKSMIETKEDGIKTIIETKFDEMIQIKNESENLRTDLEELRGQLRQFMCMKEVDRLKIAQIEETIEPVLALNLVVDQMRVELELQRQLVADLMTQIGMQQADKTRLEARLLAVETQASVTSELAVKMDSVQEHAERIQGRLQLIEDESQSRARSNMVVQTNGRDNVKKTLCTTKVSKKSVKKSKTKKKTSNTQSGMDWSNADRYEWRVAHVSMQEDRVRLSEPFSVSGYRTQLELQRFPDGSVYLRVLQGQGDTDARLEWPPGLNLRLGLTLTDTGELIKTEEMTCDTEDHPIGDGAEGSSVVDMGAEVASTGIMDSLLITLDVC